MRRVQRSPAPAATKVLPDVGRVGPCTLQPRKSGPRSPSHLGHLGEKSGDAIGYRRPRNTYSTFPGNQVADGMIEKNNISNLDALQKAASGTIFVAIDAEPWGRKGKGVAEIAISILDSVDSYQPGDPPKLLKSLRERYPAQTRFLKVSGREQGRCSQREPTMGKVEWVKPEEVESTLVIILNSIQFTVAAGSASRKLKNFRYLYSNPCGIRSII
ncbi:hypothetical protein QQZ08_011773 [Neonectria magnoliae]|uniref:Uncharacterized protein n=1 Tax=Neonectria magnoliae TaxID=2732573 RepID=A0ABR1H7F7_9HYPO